MIVVDIGGIVDHHSMSWIEGWFLLILVVELLTITQWVEVRGEVCWYWWNCWPSLNELNRGVIFVDIGGGIVDHHSMSWSERWGLLILVELLTITQLSWGERWFLSILVELLTIIQWVGVRGDFCWYWWNWWHHSMSWGERWFFLILVELLTIIQWVE